MACSCSSFCGTADQQFTAQKAETELQQYRRDGPRATTRLLRDLLGKAELVDHTLLDVGGGIGALTFELLERGVARAMLVDASAAYIASATEEAARRNKSAIVRFVHADFLDVAGQLPPAGIVTLDRVVCCHPDYERLMSAAISLSSGWLALSYPKDRWYVRAALAFENLMRRLKRNPFRTFVHSPVALQTLLARSGFQLIEQRGTFVWRVQVWRRSI
jgi:magnesium-protoporphyrin O-methyltransferase